MSFKFLNWYVREYSGRYAWLNAKLAVLKKNEHWRLITLANFDHSSLFLSSFTSIPDHRFFSSAIPDEASVNATKNLTTKFEHLLECEYLNETQCSFESSDCNLLNDNSLKHLLENYDCNLASLSDEQLVVLLRNLLLIRNKFDPKELLKFTYAVDREYVRKARSWTTEQLLVYFELYSNLPKLKRSDFAHYLVKYRQNTKLFRHDVGVVIQFIKLMNKCNFWRFYHIPKHDYEVYFNQHLAEFSISDMAVYLEFMVKVRLVVSTPNLIERICEFVLNNLSDLPVSSLIHFCQMLRLRFSIGFDRTKINSISDQLCQYLTKCGNFPADAFIEVASLCREESLVNASFFSTFAVRFRHQFSNLSLKRISDGMKYLTYFDDQVKHAVTYECLVNNLRTMCFNEITEHSREFILAMYYLSRIGIYPADLLNLLFNPEFLARAYPKGLNKYLLRNHHVLGQELLTIDGGVGIECSNYKGNRLDTNIRNNIQRYYCWTLPRLLCNDGDVNFEELARFSRASTKLLYTTRLALQKIFGGPEFVHIAYVLPHLPRPNLLFATSKPAIPAPLPASIREKMIVDRSAFDSDLEWYTFGIYAFSDGLSANSVGGVRGEEISKIRQLKKLGINVLTLMHKEWFGKTEAEIEQCLRTKIYSYVESKIKN